MSSPAAKSAGEIKISFVVTRSVTGELQVHALSESSDPAHEFHDSLRKTKGRDETGAQIFTDSVLFVRTRKNRSLHFGL